MDELSRQMRAAAAAPPPTRIDVDRLIAEDRQRRRHRAWTVAGAGIAAAVVAVAAAPALVAGPGPAQGRLTPPADAGSPSAVPSLCAVAEPSGQTYDMMPARPTEHPDASVARLTGVLRAALGTSLPAGLTVDNVVPGCDLVQFTYHSYERLRARLPDDDPRQGLRRHPEGPAADVYREYCAHARLTRGGQINGFSVSLRPTADDGQPSICAAAPDPGERTSNRLADGTVVVTSARKRGDDGHEQRWVLVQRADGTSVVVATENFPYGKRDQIPIGRAEPPMLTVDELVAIALTPGLTLYP